MEKVFTVSDAKYIGDNNETNRGILPNVYQLTDEEVEYLKKREEAEKEIINELGLPPYCYFTNETEIKKIEVDENKKTIIDFYKKELYRLGELQEEITEEYDECNINIDKYLKYIMELNDRIIEIIEKLAIESDYTSF